MGLFDFLKSSTNEEISEVISEAKKNKPEVYKEVSLYPVSMDKVREISGNKFDKVINEISLSGDFWIDGGTVYYEE